MGMIEHNKMTIEQIPLFKNKAFKNSATSHFDMAEQNDLPQRVNGNLDDTYLLDEFRAFATKMITRLENQDIDAKFGDLEDCLSYREMNHIGKLGYEGAQRSQEEYMTHFNECYVCKTLTDKSIELYENTATERT